MRIKQVTPAMMALKPARQDFPKKIHELMLYVRLGVLAAICEKSHSTVSKWYDGTSVPRHDDGETILALHRHFCSQPERVANMTIRHLKDGDIKIRCG